MIKGILLDVDGTLVLSNDLHAHSWVEAFSQFGYDVPFEEVRPLIGMGGDKLLAKLANGLDDESDTGKALSQYRTKLFLNKYLPDLKAAPGSRELVERLRRDGYKLIVASSANPKQLGALLEAAKVDDLLDTEEATTSGDAEKSKPDPDIVQAAVVKIGLPPDQVVMIGDTPYDIEAAATAGVKVIAVRCGGWDDKDLSGSIAIYNDPADLLASYDSSPLGSGGSS